MIAVEIHSLQGLREGRTETVVAGGPGCPIPGTSVSLGRHGLISPIDDLALGVQQRDLERHLAQGVGGAGQAGIVGADPHLDVVEQALV